MAKFLTATAALAALAIVPGAFAHEHGKKGIFTSAEDVAFVDIIPGTVSFGTVAGDREKGAHGTFVRIPPEKRHPRIHMARPITPL